MELEGGGSKSEKLEEREKEREKNTHGGSRAKEQRDNWIIGRHTFGPISLGSVLCCLYAAGRPQSLAPLQPETVAFGRLLLCDNIAQTVCRTETDREQWRQKAAEKAKEGAKEKAKAATA